MYKQHYQNNQNQLTLCRILYGTKKKQLLSSLFVTGLKNSLYKYNKTFDHNLYSELAI